MDYDRILELVNLLFSDYLIVESKRSSEKNKFIKIKRYNKRLDTYFKFCEIEEKVLSYSTSIYNNTSYISNNWEIHYKVNDDVFTIPIINESSIEISLNWYEKAYDIESMRIRNCQWYDEIKNNQITEIRNFKLNKIL